MVVKLNNGAIKDALISSLNGEEVAALAGLLELARIRRAGLTDLAFVRDTGARTLFGFLHKKMYGQWDYNSIVVERIMGDPNRLKEVLKESPAPTKISAVQVLQLLGSLKVSNKAIGEVAVTNHAWKRFCERYLFYHESATPEQIAFWFQQSFSRAVLCRGKKMPGKHVIYLLDQPMKCRFVVIREGYRHTLVTVERLNPQTK